MLPRRVETDKIRYGATWSAQYAEYIGVDPVDGLRESMEDLGISLLRIPVYWDRVEAQQNSYDWSEMDALMQLAEEHGADVVLVVGRRVPRWPECFVPAWINALSTEDQIHAQLTFVEQTVTRYKNSSSLLRWQVENEPFFRAFGECGDGETLATLSDEVALVRRIDPSHPVQLTASGELELWNRVAKLSDTIGVSVYRTTFTKGIGYTTYPIPPWMYRAKAWLVRPAHVVISELQMEPWFERSIQTYSPQEQVDIFSADDLRKNVDYANQVGMDEVMVWGVEWWLALRQVGHPELWEAARTIRW